MIRSVMTMGMALFSASALAAEPLFVPPFTYATPAEFAVAVMLDGMAQDQLVARGHVVLGGEVVAPVTGDPAITQCALNPTCPGSVMPRLPATLAVVASIGRSGTTLVGHVELHPQSGPPVDVLDLPIAAGSEHLFATAIVEAVDAALAQLPPAPPDRLLLAARMLAGEAIDLAPPAPLQTAPSTPLPAPSIVQLDDPAPSTPAPRASGGKLPEGVAPRHLAGSEGHFRKSGLDARDWMYRAMPHAGRFTFEVRAGLGLGDVDRFADVRVEVDGGRQVADWYQEGPDTARRVRGGLFVGYAPYTFLDVGVLVGMQYGGRDLTTGFTRVVDGEVVSSQATPSPEIQAVQVYLQPRVRGYLAPVGPAKPFVFTGMEVRFFDAYNIEQPDRLVYPVPSGGTMPGWVGGGGLMIDPGPIVGIFFEASYTAHFGGRTRLVQEGAWRFRTPSPTEAAGYTVDVSGGVQFRL
ncbi:MAG: hypothetical protein ACI8PZ_003318 [Myxococcota bacterium]|jgi:hypothetical protein